MVMPPLPSWYGGRDQVGAFLRGYVLEGAEDWRLFRVAANGQPAVAAYVWREGADAFVPHCVNVLTLRGGEIAEIAAFLDPELFPRFGLETALAA
jgi:RNA polymerase sigma-70 factor (ECF subfamily)